MKTIQYISPLILSFILLIGMASCKPTEKNYSDAYDVARLKRERDEEHRKQLDADLGIDRSQLQSDENANRRTISVPDSLGGGDFEAVYRTFNIRRSNNVAKYGASVAAFKMESNAQSLASDLVAEGFGQARAVSGSDIWYVIIADDDAPEKVVPECRRFQKRMKDFPYVGQGELIIFANPSGIKKNP